jgi:glycoside/pentoside/hexuronide:cation symporter, GPH family
MDYLGELGVLGGFIPISAIASPPPPGSAKTKNRTASAFRSAACRLMLREWAPLVCHQRATKTTSIHQRVPLSQLESNMATDQRHTIAAEDRIPWNQLVAYGMGGLIPIALFNIAGQLMGLLGNISLGLSALWLGTIMIVPRLWDAISDPIMGHLSDNTRTRWGRRRPYILVGGIAVALSFVAMWWVPRGDWIRDIFPTEDAYNWFQLAYILGGLLVFFTACTIFEIPHGALGMEMSGNYHERTRLFSAKSFLGNLFAMGTPWLIFLASLNMFRGPGGSLTDGMRYVSMFVAALLIPLTIWWFVALKEPGFAVAKEQRQTTLWADIRTTISNTTFLKLVAIIFTLAMGFNFVQIFNYYITIFYLYGGDAVAASGLLGIAGTAWAVTGLVAVFPLNWLSRRLGKNKTLLIAILLMCAAQLSKIVCYNPQLPYLVLIPTVLLSAGMLMFFTLGASMVGDICDDDELKTGTRSEGSFFAVYWWFIKMGSAFAGFVMFALLESTGFDERQNVSVDALRGNIVLIKTEAEKWLKNDVDRQARISAVEEQARLLIDNSDALRERFEQRMEKFPDQAEHLGRLIERTSSIRSEAEALRARSSGRVDDPAEIVRQADALLEQTILLKNQTPRILYRLRLVEIGLPLALSVVSILLTLFYPLTEARWMEIKAALDRRHAERAV